MEAANALGGRQAASASKIAAQPLALACPRYMCLNRRVAAAVGARFSCYWTGSGVCVRLACDNARAEPPAPEVRQPKAPER